MEGWGMREQCVVQRKALEGPRRSRVSHQTGTLADPLHGAPRLRPQGLLVSFVRPPEAPQVQIPVLWAHGAEGAPI